MITTIKLNDLNICDLDNNTFENIFKKGFNNLEGEGIVESIREEINEKVLNYITKIVVKARAKIENDFINGFYRMYSEKSSKFKNMKNIDLKGLQLLDNDIVKLTLIINNSKITKIVLQNNYRGRTGWSKPQARSFCTVVPFTYWRTEAGIRTVS